MGRLLQCYGPSLMGQTGELEINRQTVFGREAGTMTRPMVAEDKVYWVHIRVARSLGMVGSSLERLMIGVRCRVCKQEGPREGKWKLNAVVPILPVKPVSPCRSLLPMLGRLNTLTLTLKLQCFLRAYLERAYLGQLNAQHHVDASAFCRDCKPVASCIAFMQMKTADVHFRIEANAGTSSFPTP